MKQPDQLSSQPLPSSQQPELDAIATLAPQQAVQNYLNTLLQDATSVARQQDAQLEVATVADIVDLMSDEAVVETKVETVVETVVETPVEPVVAAPVVEPVVKPVAEVTTEQLAQAEPDLPSDNWKDGRPYWAQQRFECLLFKVSGLTLAVPLVELGGVLVVEQELRGLFGQPDWFLGLLPSKTAGTVKVVDTARWVMPEKCTDGGTEFKYVILMENSDWGMACHTVEDAVTLEPDQVSWRSDRGRRPWLAGTVVDHMCAIMDVSALLQLLQQSQAGNVDADQ